jgi:hypothetical protein
MFMGQQVRQCVQPGSSDSRAAAAAGDSSTGCRCCVVSMKLSSSTSAQDRCIVADVQFSFIRVQWQ